ncbi:MAG: site-specific DNA-methyltransferase, partial [Bacteroidales bacterium]|nr:site-specific DNA-methyltransferase [Bacteroidales bacterium]
MENLLIHSDNLQGLQFLLDNGYKGKIDLVYIDPPFATGINFTVSNGRANTISNSKDGEIAYSDTLKGADFIDFLRKRIVLLHELLSEKGSIYLHIDYKIGHYVKVMMDEIFGMSNFRNDITRIKCNPKNFNRVGYGNIKDLILFYTKTESPIWNEPREKYSEGDIEKLFPKKDKIGRRYTTVPIHAPGETKTSQPFKGIMPPEGRHWRTSVDVLEQWDKEGLIEWSDNGNPRKKIYCDEREGKRVQDIWDFKDPQYPVYPTEKNLEMLDLIVKTSSDEDSVVLDCFAGSGTTLLAAQRNNRFWIGIDQSDIAIKTIESKLDANKADLFSKNTDFRFLDLHKVN